MDNKKRSRDISRWILENNDTWLRMCQSPHAKFLPLEKANAESLAAVKQWIELGFYELIVIYYSLNPTLLGGPMYRVLMDRFTASDPTIIDDLMVEAQALLESRQNELGKGREGPLSDPDEE